MISRVVSDPIRVQGMNDGLARNWWAMALRGGVAIALGVLAIALPAATVATLAMLLAAWLAVDGVFALVAGLRAARRDQRWHLLILEGAVSLAAAVIAVLWPMASIFALVWLVAVWATITGLAELLSAFQMRDSHGRWLWGVTGALSILFGIAFWTVPVLGLLAIVWSIAAYAIAFGALTLMTALRLRRRHVEGPHGGAGAALP
ncbi:HdeD family acid-resistance protein [Azospirillum sp. ST 5-10]|uniref:HdeD family acid-resistance protein n=1 Tax=unclassified Azospirillum TaxID=2630922 RepID=UPI003F4A1E54